MNSPLVTVICLCYNHARFVEEAIHSVLNQSYPNIQIIVVDDASTDNSAQVIEGVVSQYPKIQFIHNQQNLGNCKAFNIALSSARGEYIIDLAADDVLLPDRVKLGVEAFEHHGSGYGVNFTDAEIIAEDGSYISNHYMRDRAGNLLDNIYVDNVFEKVIQYYYICPPTIMVRSEVYKELNGYDETLTYEDFDFWVRSSRNWKYCFTNAVLVKKRKVKNSLGSKQYKIGIQQMESTYKVCLKAEGLCKNEAEREALKKRTAYEMKHAVRLFHFQLFVKYVRLWLRLN